MFKLKEGVKLHGLQPQMILALFAALDAYGDDDVIITSANDSVHSKTSLHYAGAALDLRTRHLNRDPEEIASHMRAVLGEDFDVIAERDHIHVEYQPRR